ncbi:MAG: gluconate 2-dehydrogenase subunit 3 family protein [Motiliproteus sp.]
MAIKRRLLLQLSCIFGLATVLPSRLRWSSSKKDLNALIDTLIPNIDASAVSEALLLQFSTNKYQAKIYNRGISWLDQQSMKKFQNYFSLLTPEQRTLLLKQAENATENSIPYELFHRAHKDSLKIFYGSKQGWDFVSYYGPPQPLGYPGHDLPPDASDAKTLTLENDI